MLFFCAWESKRNAPDCKRSAEDRPTNGIFLAATGGSKNYGAQKPGKVWAKTRVFGSDALGNRIPLTHNHRGVKIGPNLVIDGPCEKCGCLRSHARRCKYFEDSFAYCVQRRYRERNASSESSSRSSDSASGSSVVGEHRPSGAPEENSEPA